MNNLLHFIQTRKGAITAVSAAIVAAAVIVSGVIFIGHTHNSTTAATTGGNTLTGCPGAAAQPNWPSNAALTIVPAEANAIKSIAIGSDLEVVLPANAVWKFNHQNGSLKMLQPAGYYDSTRSACIWRFTAQSAGQSQLYFTRQMLCKPGNVCSGIIILYTFTIQAQ